MNACFILMVPTVQRGAKVFYKVVDEGKNIPRGGSGKRENVKGAITLADSR